MDLLIVLFAGVCFLIYTTGVNNSAYAIATVVATRQLPPRLAVMMAAITNFIGGLCGSAVAITISTEILNVDFIHSFPPPNGMSHLLLNGVLAAIFWNLFALRIGVPSSTTHALMGGICGAAIALTGSDQSLMWHWQRGVEVWESAGLLWKVIVPLLFTPILGYLVAWLIMSLLNFLLRKSRPAKVNALFGPMQIVGSACVAFGMGMNNTPKYVGILLLGLISAHQRGELDNLPEYLSFLKISDNEKIPFWLLATGAFLLAVGTSIGGRRITRNIGSRVVRLKPVSGFAAQTSSASILFILSLMGLTVATSHISTSAIIGAGRAENPHSLKPRMILKILFCWLLNFPICFAIGYFLIVFSRTYDWLK